MSLRSERFTRTTLWNVPPDVSLVYGIWVGAGGAGGANPDVFDAGGKGGGGSGEFRHMFPIPVTPGGTLLVEIGDGGIASSSGGADGGDTTIGDFPALGGKGVTNGAGTTLPGDGGGPRGGVHATIVGVTADAGTGESPTAFGGAAGGIGEGAVATTGIPGGQMIGQWSQSPVANTSHHPGGSGGNSVFASGGLGSSTGDGNAGGIGCGGGGARGNAQVGDAAVVGGVGGNGYAVLFWLQ